jgi:hypothetical protein
MTMATKQCTTKNPPSTPQPTARNDPSRGILTNHGPQDTYDFMAPRQLNIPLVSAALGAVLAEQRQSVELKQAAAAERAYVSYDRLRALERGSRQATICEFLSLGEALGLDPRELFNRVLAKVRYPVGYRPHKTV